MSKMMYLVTYVRCSPIFKQNEVIMLALYKQPIITRDCHLYIFLANAFCSLWGFNCYKPKAHINLVSRLTVYTLYIIFKYIDCVTIFASLHHNYSTSQVPSQVLCIPLKLSYQTGCFTVFSLTPSKPSFQSGSV